MPRGEDVLHENHIANKHQNQVRWREAGTGGGPWRGFGGRLGGGGETQEGGGALRYWLDTYWQMAGLSGSGER